jgi:hypothetical protein
MSDASEAERLALLAKRRKLMEDWSAFALHREEGLPPASISLSAVPESDPHASREINHLCDLERALRYDAVQTVIIASTGPKSLIRPVGPEHVLILFMLNANFHKIRVGL